MRVALEVRRFSAAATLFGLLVCGCAMAGAHSSEGVPDGNAQGRGRAAKAPKGRGRVRGKVDKAVWPMTFDLKPGQEARPRGLGFAVKLEAVAEDSRCPQGVNCIWAGSVRAVLLLARPDAEPVRAEVNTNRAPGSARFEGHDITIRRVLPPKVNGKEIAPEDYIITLSVSEKSETPGG